jgi:hypothetical protein
MTRAEPLLRVYTCNKGVWLEYFQRLAIWKNKSSETPLFSSENYVLRVHAAVAKVFGDKYSDNDS